MTRGCLKRYSQLFLSKLNLATYMTNTNADEGRHRLFRLVNQAKRINSALATQFSSKFVTEAEKVLYF